MKRFGTILKHVLGASLALGATIATAAAATIVPVSVTSPDPFCCTRAPIRSIDGSGLNGLGQHSNANGDNIAWLGDILTPEITWDLGATYDLTSMHIWNYNEVNVTFYGIKDVNIFTSLDNITFSSLGGSTLAQAPGISTYLGSDYSLVGTAQYVKFQVVSNYFAPEFTGQARVGLAEIRFEGTATPEPSTFVLLGVSAVVLGLARRKRMTL